MYSKVQGVFALCVFSLMSLNSFANPSGGAVVYGQVAFSNPSANHLQVNQTSNQAVINWQRFDINVGEYTQFVQPSSQAVILNRVLGNNASKIFGRLSANGKLILINPRGIWFGPNSMVNAHSFIGSTHNISNENFLAGRYHFEALKFGAHHGGIVNEGQITVADAGLIALMAPGVANHGIIQANAGDIILASGNGFTLDFYGDDLINFTIESPSTQATDDPRGGMMSDGVSHTGRLYAHDGRILLTANHAANVVENAINIGGVVEAARVVENGGKIHLVSHGTGKVNVTGNIKARGEAKRAGEVWVLGEEILLADRASIDASGDLGGGEILIGGDYQGRGTLRASDHTKITKDIRLTADAIKTGAGGKIIVWSDGTTDMDGTLSAQGQSKGGLIETSGKQILNLADSMKIILGQGGEWLIDPPLINVTAALAATYEAMLNAGADVTVMADTIFWDSNADITSTGTGSLSLIASIAIELEDFIMSGGSGGLIDINLGTLGDFSAEINNATGTMEFQASTITARNITLTGGSRTNFVSSGSLGPITHTTFTATDTIRLNTPMFLDFNLATGSGDVNFNANRVIHPAGIILDSPANHYTVTVNLNGTNPEYQMFGALNSLGHLVVNNGPMVTSGTQSITFANPSAGSNLILAGNNANLVAKGNLTINHARPVSIAGSIVGNGTAGATSVKFNKTIANATVTAADITGKPNVIFDSSFIFNGNISDANRINFNDVMTFPNDALSITASDVIFGTDLIAPTVGKPNLALTFNVTGSDGVVFGGGTSPIQSIRVNGKSLWANNFVDLTARVSDLILNGDVVFNYDFAPQVTNNFILNGSVEGGLGSRSLTMSANNNVLGGGADTGTLNINKINVVNNKPVMIAMSNLTTSGNQTYTGPVTFSFDSNLSAMGSDIRFNSSVVGAAGTEDIIFSAASNVFMGDGTGVDNISNLRSIKFLTPVTFANSVQSISVINTKGGLLQFNHAIDLQGTNFTMGGYDISVLAGAALNEPALNLTINPGNLFTLSRDMTLDKLDVNGRMQIGPGSLTNVNAATSVEIDTLALGVSANLNTPMTTINTIDGLGLNSALFISGNFVLNTDIIGSVDVTAQPGTTTLNGNITGGSRMEFGSIDFSPGSHTINAEALFFTQAINNLGSSLNITTTVVGTIFNEGFLLDNLTVNGLASLSGFGAINVPGAFILDDVVLNRNLVMNGTDNRILGSINANNFSVTTNGPAIIGSGVGSTITNLPSITALSTIEFGGFSFGSDFLVNNAGAATFTGPINHTGADGASTLTVGGPSVTLSSNILGSPNFTANAPLTIRDEVNITGVIDLADNVATLDNATLTLNTPNTLNGAVVLNHAAMIISTANRLDFGGTVSGNQNLVIRGHHTNLGFLGVGANELTNLTLQGINNFVIAPNSRLNLLGDYTQVGNLNSANLGGGLLTPNSNTSLIAQGDISGPVTAQRLVLISHMGNLTSDINATTLFINGVNGSELTGVLGGHTIPQKGFFGLPEATTLDGAVGIFNFNGFPIMRIGMDVNTINPIYSLVEIPDMSKGFDRDDDCPIALSGFNGGGALCYTSSE